MFKQIRMFSAHGLFKAMTSIVLTQFPVEGRASMVMIIYNAWIVVLSDVHLIRYPVVPRPSRSMKNIVLIITWRQIMVLVCITFFLEKGLPAFMDGCLTNCELSFFLYFFCIVVFAFYNNDNPAVTCGRQANLYCFACADLIYHEAFDRERERIDLCAKLPWWAWQEHPLQRSFDAYQFTHVPNGSMSNPGGSMVWKGLIATYPALISPAFVRAARSTRWRQILFHGEIQELPLQTYRYIIDFAVFQNRLGMLTIPDERYIT